jgi:hypothetical protein
MPAKAEPARPTSKTMSVTKACEHGFSDGDHLIIAGCEYSYNDVIAALQPSETADQQPGYHCGKLKAECDGN